MKVLVIEDDPAVRTALQRALKLEGYDVVVAETGGAGREALARHDPDLVVLDLMLPDVDGLEVCRQMRAAGDKRPVLMLTARSAVADRVEGLDAGADDYLVKPFSLDELFARARALLRRTDREEKPLTFQGLSLDPVSYDVMRDGRPLELTRTEFQLLELFLRNPRRVLTREVIFDRVWGYDFGPTSNSLDVYIGYLRRKTEAGGEPRLIHTVRGVGYILREP